MENILKLGVQKEYNTGEVITNQASLQCANSEHSIFITHFLKQNKAINLSNLQSRSIIPTLVISRTLCSPPLRSPHPICVHQNQTTESQIQFKRKQHSLTINLNPYTCSHFKLYSLDHFLLAAYHRQKISVILLYYQKIFSRGPKLNS